VRAVLQRAGRGGVTVDGEPVASTGPGLVVLLGVAEGDGDDEARWMAAKIARLRIFEDDAGKMNRSVLDVNGDVLLVSQFTLLADCRKGRRPSFTDAAPAREGERLYLRVAELLRGEGLAVETGRFGSRMTVAIENDGPVTIVLDSVQAAGTGRERRRGTER